MGRDRTLGFGSIPQGGTHQDFIDSPVSPMGLWDGTGHWDLEVYPRVGHVRIPLTILFIPWDYGTGQDSGVWGIPQGGTRENPIDNPVHPTHGTGQDTRFLMVRTPADNSEH